MGTLFEQKPQQDQKDLTDILEWIKAAGKKTGQLYNVTGAGNLKIAMSVLNACIHEIDDATKAKAAKTQKEPEAPEVPNPPPSYG